MLPYAVSYDPYTVGHVVAQWQLLLWSGLAFTLLKLKGVYPPELKAVNLDIDWVYRRLLPGVVRATVRVGGPVRDEVLGRVKAQIGAVIAGIHQVYGPQGMFARTWLTGSAVLVVVVLLAACLVFYF